MYKKVSSELNFVPREKELAFLEGEANLPKSVRLRKGAKPYTFFGRGPPTANGKPHIGHVLTRSIKDSRAALQDHEGLRRAAQSRLGYPRPTG